MKVLLRAIDLAQLRTASTTPDVAIFTIPAGLYQPAREQEHSRSGRCSEEVALLSASGDYSYTNEEQLYKKKQEKAGALGANGIVLDSMSEPTTGARVARFLIGTPAQRTGKALAIYVVNTASR